MRSLRFLRNIRLGVSSLLLHKLRSVLTMLGVVFGVGSVIAMLAVGEGFGRHTLEQFERLGSKIILIDSIKPEQEEQTSGTSSRIAIYGLKYDDARRIAETIPDVQRVVPVRIMDRRDAWLGSRNMKLRVVGTTADWFELVRRPVLAGRMLMRRDVDNFAKVCVLTERGARKLLANKHTIGQQVDIAGNVYRVIGIVRSTGGRISASLNDMDTQSAGIQLPDRQIDAYIPISVCRENFGERDVQFESGSFSAEQVELHQIIVEAAQTERVPAAARAVQAMLRHFHNQEDYIINVPLDLLRRMEQTKRMTTIVLGSIAGISLLVGGIGIMNIMLASVTEWTREIGIRRAIGAKRRQIIGQFLTETVVLTTSGGVIGLALGPAFAVLIRQVSNMPTSVPMYSVVLSLGISLAVGIFFGLYPAIRAARLDPIVALRHE